MVLLRFADRRGIGHAGQHFRDMPDLDRAALALQLARDVHEAAEVAREQGISAAGRDVGGLALDHAVGDVRELDAEGAAEAAAGFGFLELRDLQGTVNEVINGLDHLQKRNPEIALAVVPVGTANVLAAELGLSLDVDDMVRRFLANQRRAVYFARINDQRFVMMAGFGYDAWVVQAVNARLKHYIGKLVYVLSMLWQITRYGKQRFSVECDGHIYSAYSLVVANGSHYGGNFTISRQADIGNPRFQVLLYQSKSRWRLLQYLFALPLGKMESVPTLVSFRATQIHVQAEIDDVIQLDGDIRASIKSDQLIRVVADAKPTQVIV